MCGIVGFWSTETPAGDISQVVQQMTRTLSHRGPDGDGRWADPSLGLALGHRRLSIQDTTAAGSQPMTSQCGRFVLVYNGEMYGYQKLVDRLSQQGHVLHGHSDTEVLLETIARQGVQPTLSEIQGMFAFALWDKQQKQLVLARDPLGIKPLYYGWRNNAFLFGSELKALRAFPGFTHQKDPLAVSEYCKFGYISAPLTIEKNIFKLLPGHVVTLNAADDRPRVLPYWSLVEDAYRPGTERRNASGNRSTHPNSSENVDHVFADLSQATDYLDNLLTQVIDEHLISDVPLGAFLSGGIDSSLVVALMQKLGQRQTKTFSIGFDRPEYDESGFAKSVAEHLGTDHHQWIVTSEEARTVIPKLAPMYDEPFADSSQIPTFLVSQFAKENVTVALSGDGGDESFGGYRRYPYFYNLWNKVNRFPRLARTSAGQLVSAGSRLLPIQYRDAARWRAEMLSIKNFAECYERFNRHWKFTSHLLTRDFMQGISEEPREGIAPYNMLPEGFLGNFVDDAEGVFDWMMLHDSLRYLPDDILTKVDRASMACSLETRVPLLDKRIVEFSWSLPARWKQGGDPSELAQNGKVILRELLSRYVPRPLFERSKVGFGVPLGQWLRGPLRDWAESLLGKKRLRDQGIFEAKTVHRFWESHLSGQADWEYLLWDVLMFQVCEEQL